MLKDGRISFEGLADELRASDDPYLRAFLSGVLHSNAVAPTAHQP
jgi:ABC-type transporter Mla maintaining outer membrane lipid asymmetry ATPase subunit MlaF